MKRMLANLGSAAIMLLALTGMARAQSDCGNCYVAGHSCIVTLDCGDAALQCTDIIHCDYDPCSYLVTYCSYALGKEGPRKEQRRPLYGPKGEPLYGPVAFRSSLTTPIMIDRGVKQVKVNTRFWWKVRKHA